MSTKNPKASVNNFNQKGNIAKFTVNCLSYTGHQTPAHVNVKLFGGKAVLPIGIVYGSYKTVGEGIEAHWNKTSLKVKRFTDVSIRNETICALQTRTDSPFISPFSAK